MTMFKTYRPTLLFLVLTLSLGAIIGCNNEPEQPPQSVIGSPSEVSETPTEPSIQTETEESTPDSDESVRVKVFFPKTSEGSTAIANVEPVWRNTDSTGVARFSIEQLIVGPTAEEQEKGLTPAFALTGDSNCGDDFQISINQGIAQLQFCRTIPSAEIGEDARVQNSIQSTLKQFPTVKTVVILDQEGNCLGDLSGENQCLNAGKPQDKLTSKSKLALTSLGPVEIGMTIAEASQAAGVEFSQKASGGEEYGCLYYQPDSSELDGVFIMVTEGTIARIDINSQNFSTLSGAKIGDTEEKIRSLYPDQISSQPHEYVQGGKYLFFEPKDESSQKYRVVFETDVKGRVTTFRAGRVPEVGYIEGCV